jgi:hypothetical protein
VGKVDYDEATNRLVGFVLPTDHNTGLPMKDAYLATTFEVIEGYFQTSKIAKYSILFIAQPLAPGVPAFILACIGTDNCFTTDQVLK